MTSRINVIGQNGNDALAYQSNPPASSLTNAQQRQIAIDTGMCSDGKPCGVIKFGSDGCCADCPNEPDHLPDASNMIDMASKYPKYYKDVRKLTAIDVYAVHELFGIDDSSGCIQHASKKLLLCGVRTGGKDVATEIKEARDTLTRKLQLMGVE